MITNASSNLAPIELCVAGIVDSIKTQDEYKVFDK